MGLTCKHKTVKFLEVNKGENLDDLESGNDFIAKTPKAWSVNEIIDKLDSLKFKTSALQKTLSENEKTSHRLGENISKTHIW